MKVKKLIEQLHKHYNMDDDLIVAYWDNESFEMSKEDFEQVAEDVEDRMDWSGSHEHIDWTIREILQENA